MAEDLLQEVRKAVRKAGGRGNFYGELIVKSRMYFESCILMDHRLSKWSYLFCWRSKLKLLMNIIMTTLFHKSFSVDNQCKRVSAHSVVNELVVLTTLYCLLTRLPDSECSYCKYS